MAKLFLSLGFWMTIVLFIALGYAFDFAHGAEYSETAIDHPAIATSILQDQRVADNDLQGSDVVPRSRCPQSATPRSNMADFPQMANLQGGGSAYAPGFSFSITSEPPTLSACSGPIEIPRR
jgi:hypothetical protein